MRFHVSAIVLALLVLPGCPAVDGGGGIGGGIGGGSADADADAGPGAGNPVADAGAGSSSSETQQQLLFGHGMGSYLVGEARRSMGVATDAVWFASQASGTGRVVSTGTVEQTDGQWRYDASPSDRLVVKFANAEPIEYTISIMQGDFSSTAADYLDNDHRFELRARAGVSNDMQFSSLRENGSFSSAARGKLVAPDVVYTLDLALAGTYYFENDSTGTQYRNEYRSTGTVRADGFALDVDETWFYELVTIPEEAVDAARRKIANTMTVGQDCYVWSDVLMQKSFKDGRPSQLDTYWRASGVILRNGSTYGEYKLDAELIDRDGTGYVGFVLDTPEGRTVLEKHPGS